MDIRLNHKLVFIDESGDSGMKGRGGTSDYFVLCAVFFNDVLEAAKCDLIIAQLRKQLTRSGNREYKFNKTNRREREQFLRAVAVCKFSYMAVVIDKVRLSDSGLYFKEPFRDYTAKILFDTAKPYLERATVVIDGAGNRDSRQQLGTYIKRNVNDPGRGHVVRKLKIEASHTNNLLQLADMISGAVLRSTRDDKADAALYRGIIRQKELMLQKWPKIINPPAYPFRARHLRGDSSASGQLRRR